MSDLANGLRTYRPDLDHYVFCSDAFAEQVQAWIRGVPEGKTSRNLLIVGDSGGGKTTLGLAAGGKLGAHPSDIREVNCASLRTLEDARAMLDPLNYSPSHGAFRVLILDEVHQMVANAQRAFLTPLENLPPTTIVVACSSQPELLLPEFKRRFFELRISEYSEDALIEILSSLPEKLKPSLIAAIVSAAGGNPGRALALAENSSQVEGVENPLMQDLLLVENFYQALIEGNYVKIALYAQQVKEDNRKLFFEKILRFLEASWMVSTGLAPALPPKDLVRVEGNVARLVWTGLRPEENQIKRKQFFGGLYGDFVGLSEKPLAHLKAWAMAR